MTSTIDRRTSQQPWTPPAVHDPDPIALRPILTFAALALPIGWALLFPPVLLGLPQEPFLIAALLGALLAPALVITARRSGGAGVRALLRDAVRLPRPLWWALPAALAIPVTVWWAAAVTGGAKPLSGSVVSGYITAFLSSVIIINIWEETVWTGFVQRRAMARWGTVPGSLVVAVLFVGIHIPLAFDEVSGAGDLGRNVLLLLLAGVGMRLLIAALDSWTAGSLLTVGILHGSFNATSDLVDPGSDWIRLAMTVVLGVLAVAVLLRARRTR